MQATVVIVPSFNPDQALVQLIRDLQAAGFSQIVVVNDGSRMECLPFFAQAKELGAAVLTHAVNMGKGRALKTAFNYILNTYGEEAFAVCADSDGQHTAADIRKVADKLQENPDRLVMGCRCFEEGQIPLRSRLGNKLTRFVFRIMCGVRVSDTQTGLRGLSGKLMKRFLLTRGERYEYEMNMLIDAKSDGIEMAEVPISTIYLNRNESSHFNPLWDSLRIYSVFLKFIASSIFGFAVDYLLFILLNTLIYSLMGGREANWISLFGHTFTTMTGAVLFATVLARVASSLVNYSLNKRRVFHMQTPSRSTLLRYYLLCGVQMLASAGLVALFTSLTNGYPALIKLPVDLLLFFLSFQIQREWVFKRR